MSRMRHPSLALALLVLPAFGCKEMKGVEVAAHELFPAEATVAFGFDLAPLRASPVGSMLAAAAQTDPDLASLVTAVPKCPVDLEHLRGSIAVFPSDDDDDRLVGVIESPGIGTNAVVECIEKEGRAAAGESAVGLLRFEDRGDVRIVPQEGGGHVILLNKNALVFVGEDWSAEVLAAIASPDRRNTTSSLVRATASIDREADAWFAYAMSDADRTEASDVDGAATLDALTGAAQLPGDVQLELVLHNREAAGATALAAAGKTLVDEVKPTLAASGLPATLLDTLTITVDEVRTTGKLTIAKDVVPTLLTAMGPMFAE
ncbi:MAG: hypothetical protein JNK45_14225 [Myxococcales bacterium]|nr:hypothetical protein [Myxococcales bacterium]